MKCHEHPICVATKKLIENISSNLWSVVSKIWSVPSNLGRYFFLFWSVEQFVGENENFDLKLLFLHPLENPEVLRIRSGANPKKSLFRMSKI